jgi:hypothetical protein
MHISEHLVMCGHYYCLRTLQLIQVGQVINVNYLLHLV